MLRYLIILNIIFSAVIANAADTVDIEDPVFHKIVEECGYYEFAVTDTVSYAINADSLQLDTGLDAKPFMFAGDVVNFPDTVRVFNFDESSANDELVFSLEVLDKYDTARAEIFVHDINKNLSVIRIEYIPKLIQLLPNEIDFNVANVGQQVEMNLNFISQFKDGLNIRNVRLKRGTLFNLISKPSNPFFIKQDRILNVSLSYTPLYDTYSINEFDRDTLIYESDCLEFSVPIKGRGAMPKIQVQDYNFGTTEVGEAACKYDDKSNPPDRGLEVKNIGNGFLYIDNVYFKNGSNFELENINLPINNEVYVPHSGFFLQKICFSPQTPGEHIDTLVVSNNAFGPDSIAILKGIGVEPGPYVLPLDFGRIRVGDTANAIIRIKNNGEEPALLTDVFISNVPDFSIDKNNSIPAMDDEGIIIYPEKSEFSGKLHTVSIPVIFHPQSEYQKTIKITPVFEDTLKYKPGVITNYIRGFGFLPKADFSGYIFEGNVLVNEKHPKTGIVQIKSKSYSSPLTIYSINVRRAEPITNDDFIFPNGLPDIPQNGFILDRTFPLNIMVEFFPKNDGYRNIFIDIEHDAFKGDNDSTVVTTLEVAGNAYNKVISSAPLHFRNVLHCTERTDDLRLYNISKNDTARIIHAELVSGDVDAYQILTDFFAEPIILNPGEDRGIDIQFTPYNISGKSEYEAFARVYSDKDTSTVVMSGDTYKMVVDLDLSDIEGMAPGELTTRDVPDKPYKPLNVFLNSNEHYDQLNINEVTIEIAYDPEQLLFQDFMLGDITSGWEKAVVYSKPISIDSSLFVAELSSQTNFIQENGILINPIFEILLGDTNKIDIELVRVDFGSNEECIADSLQDGSIQLSYCGEQMSKIYFSLKQYDLEAIKPNPVSTNSFNLSYSVALDAPTELSIFNSHGKLVKQIENGFIAVGEYHKNIDVSDLSSGVYMIKMVSGPYTKTIPLMIVK